MLLWKLGRSSKSKDFLAFSIVIYKGKIIAPNFQSTPRAPQMRFFKNFKRFVHNHPRTARIQGFRSVAPLGEVRRILEFIYPPLRYGIEITTFIII